MKRTEPVSIAEVMRLAIEESDLAGHLAETRAPPQRGHAWWEATSRR